MSATAPDRATVDFINDDDVDRGVIDLEQIQWSCRTQALPETGRN
jgi:hypothetical protein